MIICLSGLVNLSQVGIDALTLEKFHGDPTPVNIVLALLGLVVGTVLVGFVQRNGKVEWAVKGTEREPLIREEEGY